MIMCDLHTYVIHPFYSNNVLATLTTDVNKILTTLRNLQPQGSINFISGVRIAQVCWSVHCARFLVKLVVNSLKANVYIHTYVFTH